MNTSATGGILPAQDVAPTLVDDPLENAFHAWLSGLSGLPASMVRPEMQRLAPKQPDVGAPWLAFNVGEAEPDSNPVISHDPTGEGRDNLTRHYRVRVSVKVYGTNGGSRARQIVDAAPVAQNGETLGGLLIKFVKSSTITRSGDILQSQMVPRWDFTLDFNMQTRRTFAVLNILSVPLPGIITDHI